MAILTRAQILSAPIATKVFTIEEWGGEVRLRSLSVRSRMLLLDAIYENESAVEAYEADQARDEADREGVAKVERYDQSILTVLFCACDDDGEPLFGLDDYAYFQTLSYPTVVQLWSAIKDIDARKPTLTVEEQKKSSGKARKGASPSA